LEGEFGVTKASLKDYPTVEGIMNQKVWKLAFQKDCNLGSSTANPMVAELVAPKARHMARLMEAKKVVLIVQQSVHS